GLDAARLGTIRKTVMGDACRLEVVFYEAPASVLDLGLDEHGEVIERLLPAEITGLDWDGRRQALVDDFDLGADRHRLQGDGGNHLAEQIRILEAIRVAD